MVMNKDVLKIYQKHAPTPVKYKQAPGDWRKVATKTPFKNELRKVATPTRLQANRRVSRHKEVEFVYARHLPTPRKQKSIRSELFLLFFCEFFFLFKFYRNFVSKSFYYLFIWRFDVQCFARVFKSAENGFRYQEQQIHAQCNERTPRYYCGGG